MIDICTVIHHNYSLFHLQLRNWSWVEGEKRLLFCDNTPIPNRRNEEPDRAYPVKFDKFNMDAVGTDGESHGSTLDYIIKQTSTPIVGIVDSDFFWLKKDILADVQALFDQGIKCVGVENWYNDFELVNKKYPERASYLAPSVFGMFIDRELANETFVSTREEGSSMMAEVGWRVRKKIIDEKIPSHVYRYYQLEDQPDPSVCYFGTQETPVGIHFLKSSNPAFSRNATKLFEDFGLYELFGYPKEYIPEPEPRKISIESNFSPCLH